MSVSYVDFSRLQSEGWPQCSQLHCSCSSACYISCSGLSPVHVVILPFQALSDDIALVLQQNRLRWYGHVLRKDDDDWVKKCMEHEVEGPRPRGRPKKTWKEVVREDCLARKLNKEDAVDHCKWRRVIKEVRWPGWVWAGECFFWYQPTRVVPDKRPLNGCCCCCYQLMEWFERLPACISKLQF